MVTQQPRKVSMHKSRLANLKFWTIVTLLVTAFSFSLWKIDSGSVYEAKRMQELNVDFDRLCQIKLDEFFEEGCTDIYIQLIDIDSVKQYLDGILYFVPPEKYADLYTNSIQVLETTDIYLDAIFVDTGSLNTDLIFNKGDYIRGIKFSLDLSNKEYDSRFSDRYYPFDRYSADMSGKVEFLLPDESNTDDFLRVSNPIVSRDYTGVVPGWNVEIDYDYNISGLPYASSTMDFQQSGNFYNAFRIERSDLTKAIVLIFAVIFLGGSISLLVLLRSILMSHKKPTITGLVWAGSTTFTLIQTRNLLPGNPRSGILFDLVVFYPSIIICFACSIVILKLWINYQDSGTN